jgi:hypothetical protein
VIPAEDPPPWVTGNRQLPPTALRCREQIGERAEGAALVHLVEGSLLLAARRRLLRIAFAAGLLDHRERDAARGFVDGQDGDLDAIARNESVSVPSAPRLVLLAVRTVDWWTNPGSVDT